METRSRIRLVASHLVHELRLRESMLKNSVVLKIAQEVSSVTHEKSFTGAWNKKSTHAIYVRLGIIDENGFSKCSDGDQFRINVALGYLLKLLRKKTGLRVSDWPLVYLKGRQYLAIEYDAKEFERLSEFHRLVQAFIKKSANIGIQHRELCVRLMLSMIAFDGVVLGNNGDGRIAGIEKSMVHLDHDKPFVELPMSDKKDGYRKQYFIGEYSVGCMKILYQRAKKAGPIFPDSWQIMKRGGKPSKRKRMRRVDLEIFLSGLWKDAFPDRRIPDYLDIHFWIKQSRLSLALHGLPFVCVAHLGNRIRGAQIPANQPDKKTRQTKDNKAFEIEQDFQWLKSLHELFRIHDSAQHDKPILKEAHAFRNDFSIAVQEAEDLRKCSENEALLARWLVWMMNQRRFGDLRLSTFRTYLSAVSNRVIPLPEEKSLSKINTDEWKKAIADLAADEDYMPSSRRTAITHMKVLNEFLHEQGLAPRIDFSDYAFRVSRGVAECDIVFPHEIDLVISSVANRPNMVVALLMAFYCGLRCEEICYLTVEGALDLYRLLIGRSKLKSSCRTIPYGLFMPPKHLEILIEIIQKQACSGVTYLIQHEHDEPMPTWKLSKQVCRLLESQCLRVHKMHSLRHAFASWQFVRYFMLSDKQLRKDIEAGRFHLELDGRHPWFGKEMLSDYAEICGGGQWRWAFEQHGECQSKATDMVIISKLMGHANRFTTLENYTNSIGWVSHYYLKRRESLFFMPKK